MEVLLNNNKLSQGPFLALIKEEASESVIEKQELIPEEIELKNEPLTGDEVAAEDLFIEDGIVEQKMLSEDVPLKGISLNDGIVDSGPFIEDAAAKQEYSQDHFMAVGEQGNVQIHPRRNNGLKCTIKEEEWRELDEESTNKCTIKEEEWRELDEESTNKINFASPLQTTMLQNHHCEKLEQCFIFSQYNELNKYENEKRVPDRMEQLLLDPNINSHLTFACSMSPPETTSNANEISLNPLRNSFEETRKLTLGMKVGRLQVHSSKGTYECELCPYTTKRRSNFRCHKLVHSTVRPFKCDHCSFAAKLKSSLVRHLQETHFIKGPFECNHCSFVSKQRASLTRHLYQAHSIEKSFKCDQCSYSAKRNSSLKVHFQQAHCPERPFKCSQCSYSAKLKSVLDRHLKFHSDDRPYKCDRCPYTAKRASSINIHLKETHFNVRPHKCDQCSYTAKRRSALKIHLESLHSMTLQV